MLPGGHLQADCRLRSGRDEVALRFGQTSPRLRERFDRSGIRPVSARRRAGDGTIQALYEARCEAACERRT